MVECKGCGARIEGFKCKYCGTSISVEEACASEVISSGWLNTSHISQVDLSRMCCSIVGGPSGQ
jgi:tRNA(Ile2) C34 agmatinyltransferase TiaS